MRKKNAIVTASVVAWLLVVAFLLHGLAHNKSHVVPNSSPPGVETGHGALNPFYAQKLQWKNCGDGFDCTRLSVPLDYANPAQASISLSVVRHRAPADMTRGSLIVNPGGPGGSGIDYAKAIDYIMTPTLKDNFDVVGFDPRGVGASTPVRCLSDSQLDTYLAADQSPDNQAEVNQFVNLAKVLADGCANKNSEVYRHVDTVSAARDVDILRAALGDKKLNWFGKSYGTFLGATYADLFPKNVGRMMLDGAIDPTLSNEALSHGQALGFENALHRFVRDCATQSDCPLSHNEKTGVAQVANLLADLDQHPGHLADGRAFTQAMALTGVLGDLYDKRNGWPDLRSALLTALTGDFEALAASADFYVSRGSDGKYTSNSNEAIAAVNCLDRPDRASVTRTQSLAEQWAKQAPVFGISLAWGNLGCTYWRVPATGKPAEIHAVGAPKIVVVGTINDPATPYPWAKALAKQLASGVLLTFNGDGHTAYFQGSDCIDQYIDQYFILGRAPVGVTCTDGP